jgi:hypothetical protein
LNVAHSRERKLANEIGAICRVAILEVRTGIGSDPLAGNEVVESFHVIEIAEMAEITENSLPQSRRGAELFSFLTARATPIS